MDWEVIQDTEKALEMANYKLAEAWDMLKQSAERAAEIAIERDSLKSREKVLARLIDEKEKALEKKQEEVIAIGNLFEEAKAKLEKYTGREETAS